jgi:signal transduction histidine kinase/ActR/RegA family two-component response regulator
MGARLAVCVPLPVADKVVGVLIVFSPREQLPDEERAMLLGLADQGGLAIQNAGLYQAAQQELIERERAEEALRGVNRALRVLSECNQAVIRATEEFGLLDEICQLIIEVGGYRLAWVGFAEQDEGKTVRPMARAGSEDGYLQMVNITWADTKRGRGPTGTAIRTGEPVIARNILTDPRMAPWRTAATRRGYASSIALPLVAKGQAFGALSIFAAEPDAFDTEEVRLLTELADNLAYGIDALRTRAERQRAEEERASLLAQVQERAEQVRQIMNTVPEGVLLLDANSRVVLANPLAEEYLVTLADAQVGEALSRLGDRPLVELLTSPSKGRWHQAKTGDRIFEVAVQPIETDPATEGWVLVIWDVTQERETQQRIQQQERLAAVGQLAAGIAHDFNNIMAVIALYTQLGLRTPDLPLKLRGHLETVSRQARQATNLIQQILDFSRRAVLERRPMDLVLFLKEQIRLLERTLPESIKIGLTYGADEYMVNADPTRMQQVIMNLAFNARDAMPEGGTMRIVLERIGVEDRKEAPLPEMSPGEWVRVTMGDTGTGIPPGVLPRIFDPFFTTKAPGKGSGLGLAQVHGIVKQHEGEIDVTTKLGEGTTFILYLPALPVVEPEMLPGETSVLIQGHGETILLVEDNAAAREALVHSLETLNYQVLEAANGREALAVLDHHADEIGLILSDVVMPEMGGIALFHTLKQRELPVPVVLLTGHLVEGELQMLRAQGLGAWLRKPPSLEKLAEVIARALRESSIGS